MPKEAQGKETSDERPQESASIPPDEVLLDIVLRSLRRFPVDSEFPVDQFDGWVDLMPPRHCPHGFRGKRQGHKLWSAFQALRLVSRDFKRVVETLPFWKEMNLDRLLRITFEAEVRSWRRATYCSYCSAL